jgi:SAM-dependent methyltransferase
MIFSPQAIRRHRQRAGKTYEGGDSFLEEIGERLDERLLDIRRSFQRVLCLGHHGRITYGPPAPFKVYADPALELLHLSPSLPPEAFPICHDWEDLPFKEGSFDLICSLMVMHLVNDVPGFLKKICRSLVPNGVFLGAFLGGESLRELRQVLGEAEITSLGGLSPRVAPLPSLHQSASALQESGFSLPVVDRDVLHLSFPSLFSLLKSIRALGQGNMLAPQWRRPGSRSLFDAAERLYKARYPGEGGKGVGVTLEIVFMIGWAPGPGQPQALRPGMGEVPLSSVLSK